MVSTTERFTYNSIISPGPPMIIKKCSARKSLRLFTAVLDLKKKTDFLQVGATKSTHKATISGIMLWSSIPKRKEHTKIKEQVKKYLYNWILQHPQVEQSPISNDCLRVSIDGHSEPQLVTKLLLQFSVRELHNIIISTPEEGGLKEARDA